jgi:sarcosine oxidase gamma subunit
MAERIADSIAAMDAHRLDGITVLSLRSLSGDTAAQRAVHDAGLTWVNVPGDFAGLDPVVAWSAPGERLLLGRQAAPLRQLLAELAPGRSESALAVDLSEAMAVIELRSPLVDQWLAHLVDASAIPREPGRCSRCRLADISAMLLRLEAGRLWLVVDRPLLPYVTEWLAYSRVGLFDIPF